jgi:hypothetical protein
MVTRPPHHHYKVAELSLETVSDGVYGKALEALLNDLGPQGWRLVAIEAISAGDRRHPATATLLVTFEWQPRP